MEKTNTKNKCRRCGNLMEVREHKEINNKVLSKRYYFKEWYYCTKCGLIVQEEKNKITSING